jgi:hypothetical protein
MNDWIIASLIMVVMSAIFVRGVIRLTNKFSHDCNKHELYFEDHDSRGTFCSICHTDISIEYYQTTKGE